MKNGKRRTQSVERQLALALVDVLENVAALAGESPDLNPDLHASAREAQILLDTLGYADLQSIPRRLHDLQEKFDAALENEDFDALGRLAQEMKRAKAGKPPLSTEKKPKAAPKERKTRKKKVGQSVDLPGAVIGRALESARKDDDPAWLTSHPEPKEA